MPAYNVPAGHSRQGHLLVSGAGGPRRSYRNVRASAVAEGTPFPEGPQGRLWGGLLSSSARAGLLPGCLSVLRDFRPGLSPTSEREGERERFIDNQ